MPINNELRTTWEEFALVSADQFCYDETVFIGGDKLKCKIEYDLADYKIHFIAYQHRTATFSAQKVFTKVFIPLSKSIKFRFSVYPENFAAKLLKVAGMQDIIIGIKELDNNFVFKGKDENRIKKIFSDDQVIKLMLANPDLNLRIKKGKKLLETELPENSNFLIFETDQLIIEKEYLNNLLALFKAVMNGMNS